MTTPGIDWTMVPFRKSSFSDVTGGDCLEIGVMSGVIGIRDSKSPAPAHLELPASRWASFTTAVKTGRF